MRTLHNGHLLAETVEDLPNTAGYKTLFLDFETSGLDPYMGSIVCGVALVCDSEKQAIYVPVNHHFGPKLPKENFDRWLEETFQGKERWVNHNVKFDAHFATKNGVPVEKIPQLIDTLPLSRMHYTNRRTYGLKPLCRDWLRMPMDEERALQPYFKQYGKKFGHAPVPSDIEAPYACMDVIGNRRLMSFLVQKRDPRLKLVWDIENQLTSTLFRMEQRGMRIDILETKKQYLKTLRILVELQEQLAEFTNGEEFVDSNKILLEMLVIQWGLPIVGYNEQDDGRKTPSFDKEALALYAVHPQVLGEPKLKRLIELIREYRHHSQLSSLYLEPYQNLADENGDLHTSYTQVIRTGRMSAKHPNAQQLNKWAKSLIVPRPGRAFISADASQLEYRWIGDTIEEEKIIHAYQTDPKTDFHTLAAQLIQSSRSSGKTMNFTLSFGAGKAKVISYLKKDKEILERISKQTSDPKEFEELCKKEAERIWSTYHQEFPNLHKESKAAEGAARKNGYIVNKFGRIRHLFRDETYKAFNTYIQGTASDYVKSRLVALDTQEFWDLGVWPLITVHDEIVMEGDVEAIEDPYVQKRVREVLQECPIPCKIPLLWDIGSSRLNWRQATVNSDHNKNDDPVPT
jgi:DNA polymerase I